MKKIKLTIQGASPILMHRFPMEPIEAIEKKTKEEQAEISAYRMPSGNLYIPGIAFHRALISSARYSKGKGRFSLQGEVAGGVMVLDEYLDLGVDKYEIDARSVVVRATGGRIVRVRPRLNDWSVKIILEYDENLLTATQLRKVIDDCGSRVGLLDFRPERKGLFGRFIVTGWK